jgi:hypothetical protein
MSTIIPRRLLRFTRPWDQFLIIMPTITSMAFVVTTAYASIKRIRETAVLALREGGVSDAVVARFLSDANVFAFIFWAFAVIFCLLGFVWVALMSYRIFGPFARLERELIAIREGVMDPAGLRVRQKDALFKIVELFRQILIRSRK